MFICSNMASKRSSCKQYTPERQQNNAVRRRYYRSLCLLLLLLLLFWLMFPLLLNLHLSEVYDSQPRFSSRKKAQIKPGGREERREGVRERKKGRKRGVYPRCVCEGEQRLQIRPPLFELQEARSSSPQQTAAHTSWSGALAFWHCCAQTCV